MIRVSVMFVLLGTCFLLPGQAQQAKPEKPLTSQQKDGRRLFQQRCAVCHTTPTVNSKRYGPALYDTLVKSNKAFIQHSIADGFEGLMPGFKYTLEQTEINSIIDYLGTLPKPGSGSKNKKNQYPSD